MDSTVTPRPSDTTPDAERVQVDLLRAATAGRRLHVAVALTATVIALARRALERSRPGVSTRERDLLFVELHYGREIAEGLRADLARRDVC